MKKYGVEGNGNVQRKSKGITLTALVITVIVLLILATITVSTFTGNSIITQTKKAREDAEINSEMKVIGTSSNQAKNQNKYGDLTEIPFREALDSNAGKGKTKVTYYAEQNAFTVEFEKSKRVYFVSATGNAKYMGKLEDALMISTVSEPKNIVSLHESYNVKVIIESFVEKNIIDGIIEYEWTKSEDEPHSYNKTIQVVNDGTPLKKITKKL